MTSPVNPQENDLPPLPPGVRLTTLRNGLTIIVREDHSAPVVSAQVWCKAGSMHEGAWLGAGLSHVLEHMLFKGTTTRPGGRIDQEVQEAGGYMNAYTSFDRTVYYINVPDTGARIAIDILCDIVQNATLPAEEMLKEKQVILREMDMNQDNPDQRSARRLFETAYTHSSLRFPIIGYPDIFNLLKREDVFAYYRDKYAPNNLFFVVVGDIDARAVEAQIREAFTQTPARPMTPVFTQNEPEQISPRLILEEASIELGHLHMSWHIPSLRHSDVPALEILSTLLGSGRSSRLYQEIRERKALAVSVDAWTYNPGETGLFGISALVTPDKFESARQAIFEEVARVIGGDVTEAEVNKAVKQFVAATLATRKTMQGQAQDLGANWHSAQDLNFSERYLESIKAVTTADVTRVAARYLQAKRRTLYALLPENTTPQEHAVSTQKSEHSIEKVELPNGLTLLLKEDHRLPFVEFRSVFRGGVLAETRENNGISALTARLLLKGTRRRSAEEISREIEAVGGSIDTYGGNNSMGVNVEVMSTDFDLGLELLADVLLEPAFPEQALERERQVQLAAIRAQRDHLLQSCNRTMKETLFGGRGYGLDASGSEASLSRLTRDQIEAFHHRFFAPNNGVIAVFGDIDPAAVKRAVTERFGRWEKSHEAAPAHPSDAIMSVRRAVETRDKKQAVLVVGFPGTSVHSTDRYALELIQEACSDLGSRLFMRIREELGLAYYVGAQNFLGLTPGYFSFYVGTEPEKVALVEKEILAQAELLRTNGLTAEELNRSKAKVLGQKKIGRQDLGSLAMMSALDELYGLGYDYSEKEDACFEAVTVGETREVAGRYLRPDVHVISLIEPEPTAGESSASKAA